MNRFDNFLSDVFTSKKALAAMATLLLIVLQSLGLPISEEVLNKILMVVAPYLVGQGIADSGKEAAKIKATFEDPTYKPYQPVRS
jgi:hypothetical protein